MWISSLFMNCLKSYKYIDLYCICREHGFTVADLIKKARIKFDTHIDLLQLGAQFMKVKETSDHPRMLHDLPALQWQEFFVIEAKKLQSRIIK